MYNKEQFEEILEKATPRTYQQTASFVCSLINKLEENSIEDDELKSKFDALLDAFTRYFEQDKKAKKTINRTYREIVGYVKEKYNWEQRGNVQGTYMAICIGVGVALGSALSTTIGVAFMGGGIAIGAGVGVAIGTSMEKKAQEEGRLY